MPDEYDKERRDGTERRSRPPQTHVTVDGLSNGAATAVASVEAKLDMLIKVLAGLAVLAVPIGMAGVGGIWNMGRQMAALTADVEHLPSRVAIDEMIERRTEELREQMIETAAQSELAKQMGSEGLNSLSASIKVLHEQQTALRRDFEREHGGGP